MPKTVAAKALEAFEWNGRTFSAGEDIPALPTVDALILLRKGAIHVPLTRKAKRPATAAPAEKMPVSRSRRRYRRSDLQAETASAPAPVFVPEEPDADAPEPLLTQDLTPEDEDS